MTKKCSIRSEEAPCRWDNRIAPALKKGRIAKGLTHIDGVQVGQKAPDVIQQDVAALEAVQRTVAIMRSNPQFTTSVPSFVEQLLDRIS